MIGLFDSGVGGLAIARAVRQRMPRLDMAYVSDAAWFPYGEKAPHALADRTAEIVRFLVRQGARLVVVACNSASGAAIVELRRRFDIPFVGVEPAVKVAADSDHIRRVGVLCTEVTAGGDRYRGLVERVAGGAEVVTAPSRVLAPLVEAGRQAAPEARALVAREIRPLLDAGVQAIALGCTHYAFLQPLVEELSGLPVLEPSAAVARQVERVLRQLAPEALAGSGRSLLYTSGSLAALDRFVEQQGLQGAAARPMTLGDD